MKTNGSYDVSGLRHHLIYSIQKIRVIRENYIFDDSFDRLLKFYLGCFFRRCSRNSLLILKKSLYIINYTITTHNGINVHCANYKLNYISAII